MIQTAQNLVLGRSSGDAEGVFPSVTIRNFRCIRDVTIDLGPFTVLVGGNGAGKTAILDALDRRDFSPDTPPDGSLPEVILHTDAGTEQTNVLAPKPGRTELAMRFGSNHTYQKLHPNPAVMRKPIQLAPEPLLSEDGSNLPNVLNSLGRRKLETISQMFCEAVPIYRDVDLRAYGQGEHGLVFQDRWTETRWYTTAEVSDGTLIMLALLVACHQQERLHILAIDEMERGLHPFLLQRVVEMYRELSTGKYGHAVQIVGATHSPALLDLLQPDEVRFVSRDRKTGHTVVRSAPTDSNGWTAALETYKNSLGDLWLSGALGGVPGV